MNVLIAFDVINAIIVKSIIFNLKYSKEPCYEQENDLPGIDPGACHYRLYFQQRDTAYANECASRRATHGATSGAAHGTASSATIINRQRPLPG